MTLKRSIYCFISSIWDRIVRHASKQEGIRILLYHSVGEGLFHDTYGMTVSIESFTDQINLISEDKRFEVIPLNLSDDYLSFEENPDKVKLAITFDDGYRDNLYTAAPILLGRNIPFSVFVTPEFTRKVDGIYLTGQELRELSGMSGVTIGSHGRTHRRLTGLSSRDLLAELSESRSSIEDIIDKKVDMLSYPHGKFDRRVRTAAVDSGYRLGFGSRFGINTKKSDPMFMRRIEVWNEDTSEIFCQKLGGGWDWYGTYQRMKGL